MTCSEGIETVLTPPLVIIGGGKVSVSITDAETAVVFKDASSYAPISILNSSVTHTFAGSNQWTGVFCCGRHHSVPDRDDGFYNA